MIFFLTIKGVKVIERYISTNRSKHIVSSMCEFYMVGNCHSKAPRMTTYVTKVSPTFSYKILLLEKCSVVELDELEFKVKVW